MKPSNVGESNKWPPALETGMVNPRYVIVALVAHEPVKPHQSFDAMSADLSESSTTVPRELEILFAVRRSFAATQKEPL